MNRKQEKRPPRIRRRTKEGRGERGGESGEKTPEEKKEFFTRITSLEKNSVSRMENPSPHTSASESSIKTLSTIIPKPKSMEKSKLKLKSQELIPKKAVPQKYKTITLSLMVPQSAHDPVEKNMSYTISKTPKIENKIESTVLEMGSKEELLESKKEGMEVSRDLAEINRETGEEDEKEEDPFFRWEAGGRPNPLSHSKCIILVQRKNEPLMEVLKACLRDEYRFYVGGEPEGEAVDEFGGELRLPPIRKKVISLNLERRGFNPSIGARGEARLMKGERDFCPTLASYIASFETGKKPGFFVLVIPEEWESRRPSTQDFAKKLRERLQRMIQEEIEGEKRDTRDLITIARPKYEKFSGETELFHKYWGFRGTSETGLQASFTELEDAYWRILNREKWYESLLSEKSGSDSDESTEHYLLKTKIAGAYFRYLLRRYDYKPTLDDMKEFWEKENPKEVIDVEAENEDAENEKRADLKINLSENDRAKKAFRAFLKFEEEEIEEFDGTAYIEIETGFGERQFGNRKIVKTMENHEDGSLKNVIIVLLNRLQHLDPAGVRELIKISEIKDVKLAVPVFERRGKGRLVGIENVRKSILKRLFEWESERNST